MQLKVNGNPVEIEGPSTLSQVLEELGHKGRKFAVAVDGGFIPRDRYASLQLNGGESLEVLSPMQGG